MCLLSNNEQFQLAKSQQEVQMEMVICPQHTHFWKWVISYSYKQFQAALHALPFFSKIAVLLLTAFIT